VVGSLTGYIQQNDTETPQQDEQPSSTTEESAVFRVVHAAPDAPDIDVYVDDRRQVTDMNFGDVSSYFTVGPGQYRMEVTEDNDRQQGLVSEEITATAGSVTTAVVTSEPTTGTNSTVAVELLEDDLSKPVDGTARVRLFHASPDAPPITARITEALGEHTNTSATASPLVAALGFGEAATTEVSSGMQTLGLFPAAQQQSPPNSTAEEGTALAEIELLLQNGGVYSVFAVGNLSPTGVVADEEFELVAVQDAVDGTRSNGARQ
jgi:hypothetical protein